MNYYMNNLQHMVTAHWSRGASMPKGVAAPHFCAVRVVEIRHTMTKQSYNSLAASVTMQSKALVYVCSVSEWASLNSEVISIGVVYLAGDGLARPKQNFCLVQLTVSPTCPPVLCIMWGAKCLRFLRGKLRFYWKARVLNLGGIWLSDTWYRSPQYPGSGVPLLISLNSMGNGFGNGLYI